MRASPTDASVAEESLDWDLRRPDSARRLAGGLWASNSLSACLPHRAVARIERRGGPYVKWIDLSDDVMGHERPPPSECHAQHPLAHDRCKCKKVKPTLATYLNKNYTYVIHAKVKSLERGSCSEITTMVDVKDVLKSSTPVPRSLVPLYTNSSCQCPPLLPNQDVLIMCYEWRSRLMLLDGCSVEKWKDPLSKRFKRWEQRLQEQKLQAAPNKNQNARHSGRSGVLKQNSKNANPVLAGAKKINKLRSDQKEVNSKKN